MNYNNYIFADFETTSANPYKTQPTQLSAAVIDGRTLEVVDTFNSYIGILNEEDSQKYGLDYMTEGASQVTGITAEMLESAPSLKVVWGNFVEFSKKHNPKGNKWTRPILCGYNHIKFDLPIMNRICRGHNPYRNDVTQLAENYIDDEKYRAKFLKEYKEKYCLEPWGFGPWDNDRDEQAMFHPRDTIDLMHTVFQWTENLKGFHSISMDNLRKVMDMDMDNSHNALVDVLQGSFLLIKFLKYMRTQSKKMKFEGCFKTLNGRIKELAKI